MKMLLANWKTKLRVEILGWCLVFGKSGNVWSGFQQSRNRQHQILASLLIKIVTDIENKHDGLTEKCTKLKLKEKKYQMALSLVQADVSDLMRSKCATFWTLSKTWTLNSLWGTCPLHDSISCHMLFYFALIKRLSNKSIK